MNNILCLARLITACALLLPVPIGGCAQQYATPQQAAANSCSAFGPRASSGALIGGLAGASGGALIGGLAGHSAKAALIGGGVGALLGVAAGAVAGHNLDQRDCAAAQVALQSIGNAPDGQAINWSDPSTGSSGSYTPTAAEYTDPKSGLICRPVSNSYYLHGHQPVVGETGNTCRDANGDWSMQTSPNPGVSA